MSTSLFFNLSFDLGGISLILFVVWFFVNFHNSEAAFKWFSLSILALLASVIILSYGATKLSEVKSSMPQQNESEIMDLKQEVATLKAKKHSTAPIHKPKAKKHSMHHKKEDRSSASDVKWPRRIVTNHDNQIVKKVVSKHPHHIYLIAKIDNPEDPVIARGVHSGQHYYIHGHHNSFKANEFVIIKGTATRVEDNSINVTATSGKYQPNSPKPM